MTQLSKITSVANEMVMFEALPYLKEIMREVVEKEYILQCMFDAIGLASEKEEFKKELSAMPDVTLTRREKEEIEDEIIEKMRMVLSESSKQAGRIYMAQKMFPSQLLSGEDNKLLTDNKDENND